MTMMKCGCLRRGSNTSRDDEILIAYINNAYLPA